MTGRRESPVHPDVKGNDIAVKEKLMNDMAPVAAGILHPARRTSVWF